MTLDEAKAEMMKGARMTRAMRGWGTGYHYATGPDRFVVAWPSGDFKVVDAAPIRAAWGPPDWVPYTGPIADDPRFPIVSAG